MREYWGEMVRITSEKSLRNHQLRLSLANGKIALDNPWSCTYHTKSCAKSLTSNAWNIHCDNRVERGTESHDE